MSTGCRFRLTLSRPCILILDQIDTSDYVLERD